MKLPYNIGDIIKIYESDSKTIAFAIILSIDWGWSDLFIFEEKNNLKVGMIKMLCMGKIKSATTMEIRGVISKL